MNKTTTRISYCLGVSFLLLSYCVHAQHVDGSSQSNPIIVPQSLATAYFQDRNDISAVNYAYGINGAEAQLVQFWSSKTNTQVTFNLTSLNTYDRQGKVVEIQRRLLLVNNISDPGDKNYYVYPYDPIVSLSVCDGKITARDNSSNDAGIPRRCELLLNNNIVAFQDAGSNTFEFSNNVQAGLTYTVKIKIFSTTGRPGSTGHVYQGVSAPVTVPGSAGLSANKSTVCSGQEVQLTATGGGSYQWSTGSQTSSQIRVYPAATTTYSVSVTQGAGCPAIVHSVTVSVPSPTVSIQTSTQAICSGSSVQLRAIGSSSNTYNWSQANGDQSTFAGSTSGMIVNVQPIATTTYQVTVSDGQCEATAQQQITVNPSPSVSIDPIPSPVNVGTSLTLFGRPSGGAWPYKYRWSTNATTSSIPIIANTSTTYYLTVEDNKTCTAGAQVQVTVNPKPTVSISPVPNPICPGTPTPLNSTVSGGTTPYTYRWSTGDTTPNINVAPTATATYRLTVTDQQGKKDSTQIQVLVHPKPVPSIQGTQPNCVGQSTELTASGGNTYLWTGGATTASFTVNPAQSTTYYVTVKNTFNCSAVDSFRVVVPAALQLSHSLQNDQDCTHNNVTVVPSPLNAQAPLSYSIQRNGTTTPNPSLSNLTTDNFTLIVTDNKGCTGSTSVTINEAAALRITLSKEREHDCTPGNTKINVSTTGARGALSYRLNGGAPHNTTAYLINVPNGLHTVSVQDAFGCVASDTVRIAEDSLLVVAEPLIKHVTCPRGSDGSISLQVRGGTGTYYFNWSNLGSSTNVLSNIPRGSYTVTVVDSRNCQVIKTAEVYQPGEIGYGARMVAKDLTCYQSNDASLEFTVPFSGGTGPYTFNWSNGSTTNIASNLASGNYTLTVTDALGCKVYYNSAVSQPSAINSSPQYTNHLDCISNNVRITVAATGGRGGYSYSLDGGPAQNSGIFTGQSNGAHQLVIKDSANCSKTFTIQVVEHVPFTLGYRLENDQDCIPNNTTIVPLPENAQGAISYILVRNGNINVNPSLSGRGSGTYTLSGLDSKGCSAGVTVTINEKIPPLPIHLDTLTVCAGVPATMSVRGAPVSGVVYTWTVPAGANNPGNVASFITTAAGVYSVIMTDTNTGCSSSAQGEIRHTPGPDPDLCCSQSICAGQGTFLSSNNYTPLGFAWSTGASTRGISVSPVQNTTYTLTVTDAAGCKGTAQVSVDILPKPSVRIDSVPPICSGDTLTLRAVVSSGTAPYVYYWGSGSSGSTFKVSPSSTSTYTVSITDVNGCMASAQVVVPVRTRPSVELGADQIVCTGTNSTLRADVLNGTAPFTYAWSTGATQSLINVVPSTTTTYIVTVTDAIGCKSSDQVTVQVNPRPILDLGLDTTLCAGISATLRANIIGGTAPFSYNWSNGGSGSTINVNPASTSIYTLTVTDTRGCMVIGSKRITVLPKPVLSVGPDRAICVGSSTTLNATASSGNPPLTYVWSTGASTSNLSISPSATTSYTVTVTDGRACSQVDTIIVVVNTTTAGISGNSTACVGQNTTLTATGGGTYLWSTGAGTSSIVVSPSTTTTYTVTVTNQGCSNTATHVLNVSTTNLSLIAPNILNTTDCQTGNIAFEVKYTGTNTPGLEFRMNGGAWQSSPWFTNRSAGTYLIEGRVVTPTCILSLNSRNGSVTELSGASVVSSITVSNVTDCTAGNARIQVNLTQTTTAQYRLAGVTSWGSSNAFTSRSTGTYYVEVRPSSTATCLERDTVTFDEKTASIGTLAITGTDDCIVGNLRIEIPATGTLGSAPLQFRLNSSSTPSYATPWQNSNVFINPPNSFSLNRAEVKTSSGCVFVKNIDIAHNEVDPLNLDITGLTYISGATDCIKGNTRVSITTYAGEGVSIGLWRINGGAWNGSPEFSGLGRDSIYVEVNAGDDIRTCIVGKKLFVNERSTPDITQLVLSQHEDCTLNNAQITIQSTGGTGTIRYKLNSGSLSTNPIFSNLGSGNHLVTVRDGNACQDTMSVRITEPVLLAITTSKANESDCTGGNARITVSATGARGTLSYRINGGTPQASNIFNNLSNGSYTVTAIDGAGCTASRAVTINETGALIATPVKSGETDCVLGNASVAINVTGALSTLSYRLNGGTAQASNVFGSLSNGSHTISVQDAGGCSTSTTFTVNEPLPLSLGTPQIQAVRCFGEASGSIGLAVSGGVTPHTINWSNGAQGGVNQYIPAGTYTFTVTDSRGCILPGAAVVPAPPAFQVQLSNFVDVACHNGTTGAISATVTGGLSPYTYRWSNNASTSSISNVGAGNYGLTVTDANGCVATATGSLANPAPLLLRHELANEQDCIANNLSITALASGGRGNYAFRLNGGTPQASGLFTGKTTGTYTLTLQDGAGCSAVPLVLGLITETLPPPVISIDTVRECVGTPASLSINNAPGTGMQYNWSVPNGANTPGNVAQFSTLIAGTYSVVMTDTATGCTRTASGVVVHKPLPIADVCCKDTICAGDSLTLYSNPGYATYLWSNGVTTASNRVSPLATTTYTLTVTGSNGCSATDQEVIVVNTKPVVQILGKDSLCLGTKDTLRLQTSGGTLPYTYLWNTGSTAASLFVDTTSSVLYTVEVRDSNTCISRDSFALTINPLPVVQVKAADTLRCDNPQVLLEPLTASGSLQFQWKTSAGHTLADSSQVWVDSMDTYIVEVVDSVGCSSSDSTRVITYIPQIVQIDSLPSTHCDSANAQIHIQLSNPGAWLYRIDSTQWDTSATFSGLLMGTYAIAIASPDTSCIIDTTITIGSREICIEICAGDSILIGKPGLNPWCMKWLPEDGLSTPDSSYTWVKPTTSTTYRLIITDDDGNILDSLIYKVTLCPQLSVSPAVLNLCEQNNPILSAVGGSGPYIWRNQNGAMVGEGQTYAPTEPGTYTVQQSNNLALAASANVSKQLGNKKLQIEPGLAAICGDSVRLSVAGNFHNFVWRDGNGQTLSQKSYAFIKQQGTYTLAAEAGEGCVLDTQTTVFASGFALSIPAADVVISCNKTRSLPYPIVETRYGSGIDSLLVTAPEHYQFRAEWRKDCQSCGQVRLSIESDESIGENTPCTKVIRRTWVARDECGRRATATQIIRWQDLTAPQFVQFPESDTLAWGWPLPTETPIVSDNCDTSPRVTRTVDSMATDSIKVVNILWQIRDTCGNLTERTQVITYLRPPVEDTFNLVARYNCGDTYVNQIPSNQVPLNTLQPNNVIDAYGFAVQITRVDPPVVNPAGIYSGEAVALIPFFDKPARFTFRNLKLNSSLEVLSGDLLSAADPGFTLPSLETAQSNLDICLPPPPPPPGNNGENDGGFNADGKYAKVPPYEGYEPGDVYDPTRDPNGFDAEGLHVETGTLYNPQGCSVKGLDSLGQKCNPEGSGPYYWLNSNGLDGPPTGGGTKLANTVRDTIRSLVIKVLQELKRINDSLELVLKVNCDALREGVDSAYTSTGMDRRNMVFGYADQFFAEGLSKEFETKPKLLPETVQREATHLNLQKKHLKLYECDDELHKLRALGVLLLSMQEDPGLSNLVKAMLDRLKRVSDADTATLNAIPQLITWLSEQVSDYTTNLNNFNYNRTGSIDATPKSQRIKYARDWAEQPRHTVFSAVDASAQAATKAAALKAEFESGAEYIAGVHRAFYLRELVEHRKSQWFTPADTLQKGASLFPVEISKEVNGRKQSILLDQLRIGANGALVNAYAIVNISGKEIVFRAIDVPINPAGLQNDGQIYLANDVEIRLSNSAMLVLKSNGTYASWDCAGFDGVHVQADLELCNSLVVPVNPATQQVINTDERVKAHINAFVEDFNNFTVGVTVDPFAVKGYEDFQFTIQNAIADFSDTETPTAIRFPDNYKFPEGNNERWRGIYFGQVSITTPLNFSGEGGQNLVLGAEKFLFDDQGVTGKAFLANVVSLSQGNFGGWAGSVDTLMVGFVANHFAGGGFSGHIHLPLFGKPQGEIGPEDCFRYQATIEPKQVYRFKVLPQSDMTMDLLKAKATLSSNSSIELALVRGKFKARAVLTGDVVIDSLAAFSNSSGTGGLRLNIPPLHFEGLTLSNEAPYFGAGTWTTPANLKTSVGGFKANLSNIHVVSKSDTEAGLHFGLDLSLSDDFPVSAKGAFEIYGELNTDNGRQRWRGKGFRMDRLIVDGDIKGNTVYGEIFRFGEGTSGGFGSGYRGILKVKFAKLDAGVEALGQFGDMGSFKYFMVDAMATLPGKGVPLGAMYIKKLGGGLSHHMTRTDDVSFPTNWGNPNGAAASLGELGVSLSGIQYFPSIERGLGLRLALMLTAEKEEAFNATVGLEAIFNSKEGGGGISTIAMDGFIQFMTKPNPALVPVKSANNGMDNPSNSIPNASKVAGFISIKYNFDAKIFDANFRVFFNTNNLFGNGDARLYFSPGKWFINIGEPSNRVDLTLRVPGLPANAVTMSTYLDIGNAIPALPPLPAHIRELTGLGNTQGAESSRGSGSGFAFGADVQLNTGELRFLILYASLNAGVGFDLQLQQYGGASCAGSGELGINGWYASGQMWAYVQAEVGLQLKKNGNKFPIASLSAGVALQGQLPNPFWARGSLAGRYKILGGLVKGNFNFKFTIGEPCDLVDESGQPIPEPELSLISELQPQRQALGQSQLLRPKAIFTLPMEKRKLPMLDEDGNTVLYETRLKTMELRDSLGQAISCSRIYSKDSLQVSLAPVELLPANTRFTFYVEATYGKNGQVLVTDIDTLSFRTGSASSGIPADNVAYSYPAIGMQSFYRYEKADRQGYIQLKVGQRELLAFGQPVFARFEGGGGSTETLVSYSNFDNRLSFEIPADALQAATAYTLSIVSEGKVLLSFPFRSSQYAYFKDKMAAFAGAASSSWKDWNLELKAPAIEPFDDAEALGQNGEPPLVAFEMVIDNYAWYLNNFKKIYSKGAFDSFKSFEPLSRDVNASGPKGELALGFATTTTLENRLHVVLRQDLDDFKDQAALAEAQRLKTCGNDTSSRGCEKDAALDAFIGSSIPVPGVGSIPVMATYRLPGSKSVNSSTHFTWSFGVKTNIQN